MSTSQIKKCDGCGVTVLVDENRRESILQGIPVLPWWDVAFHSSDFKGPSGGEEMRSFRMRWIAWDLCSDCKTKALDAIVAAVGKPHHDDSSDDDSEVEVPE